jgi:hypothetical protein
VERCKDYICFVAWFAGLSYMALWPLTAHGVGGRGLGADWTLPPTLHAVGILAAAFVNMRIVAIVFKRWRSRHAAAPAAAITPELVEARLGPQRWKAPPAAQVKPRSQFGLRGKQHLAP